MSMESFQKLLYDMFCLWHDVRRHYDPPLIEDAQQKMQKVRNMIGKFLTEVDARIGRMTPLIDGAGEDWSQDQFEEWATLTWNVLCVTSRLQAAIYTNDAGHAFVASDDKHVLMKLNEALVQLVNLARSIRPPPGVSEDDPGYQNFFQLFTQTLHSLHQFYVELKSANESADEFAIKLHNFGDMELRPCINSFKEFCNSRCVELWRNVRAAQIQRMMDYQPLPEGPVDQLVAFYSNMVYTLAIIAARLQGVRYEALTGKGVFVQFFDPVQPLSEMVFSALELLMSDCVLATEPSTNAILVTNNLFAMHCGALARGVVFRDFDVQVVSEETAAQIQAEMRRQKMLQQPTTIGEFSSAALLAMKPTTGVKRTNSSAEGNGSNTAHKKSDVNSKDVVTIYPGFNAKYKFWAASYPHLLCTTRQKGRHSTSYQDLSPGALNEKTGQIGKRPIFYFHIQATMFSPSGRYATAHTLSLPFTIATRRNQDCQVQRMMSSYTATCFWIYGTNIQDGLLLNWTDTGMHWDHFKHLYSQHFKVNADVSRGLLDRDFVLLQYKLQCQDCAAGGIGGPSRKNGAQRIITFKNALCPHLRYECGATNVRFSVWRGMLELLQIFQDSRTNVRQLWENGLLLGLLEFDQVAELLKPHESALIMRLSFVTGGSICFTVKSNAHAMGPGATAPMHLEPLDLKRLQAKSLQEYLRDIAIAEKVKYIMNANLELVKVSEVLEQFNMRLTNGVDSSSRDISSNVTHTGDIDAMQHIRFTAMRIAVVTCKVKPPSSDNSIELEQELPRKLSNGLLTPTGTVDFADELAHLMAKYGKTKQETVDAINNISTNGLNRHQNNY